jgi:LysR family glycine cleavage system transcriptional activator
MRKLPPLNALLVFEAVARHRSFTRAADYLCLTQGAVSRQIISLEDYYGFPLFIRHIKGLRLTPEGETLLPVAIDCFSRLEEISLRLTRQQTGLTLKIPSCVMRWILPRIMRFQTAFPEIQLQITTSGQHEVDFQREPFDAAIIYGRSPGPEVYATELLQEQLTPVCSPGLLANRRLESVTDLGAVTLLHPSRDHRDWKMWLEHAGENSISADKGQSFETLDLATNAAAQGFGVAIGDVALAQEEFELNRLVMPFELQLKTGYSYFFVYPECVARQDKVTLLRDWLAQQGDPA